MASKASKKEKKDEAPATAVASMASLVKLLEEHETHFPRNLTKLDFVQETVTDHGNRLTSLEANANQLSNKMEELEAKCAAMEGSYNKLKAKAIDQGYSTSLASGPNRKITGVCGPHNTFFKESLQITLAYSSGARPTDFFSRLLVELLGDQVLTTAPELDRAHRALTAKQGPGQDQERTKELIVQEARKRRGKLFFQGKPVAIFEDYCPEMEQRAAYREVMSALYQRGLRPSLLYPARLRITTKDGGKKHFASVEDATSFLKTLQGNTRSLRLERSSDGQL
ncbi:hypothetical protein F7725_001745 [Dissostichus mawsoni]|uniref:LINE-1 type transposase domain-containing protein 1 n=1 Tax=Dissostichus mawsoni TaxID=36200 RepID=A0A7J5Y0I3_DISMA|nr:hypothetical protein F7725_001745 [Dissostichus mawsoni]